MKCLHWLYGNGQAAISLITDILWLSIFAGRYTSVVTRGLSKAAIELFSAAANNQVHGSTGPLICSVNNECL